ncbi:helix-turn-helix domain-containing protein [Algoriphagus sp.]|uniref:helix-turn-helix domain-containing protein n=1 Tax=Algoriphagus sp. TaxID=1872435 RepID=UPI003F72354F
MNNDLKAYRIAFGQNLKTLREGRKLSPAELAEKMDQVDPKQIYRVENAEHIPSHEFVIAVGIALGYTPTQIHDFEFDLTLNTDFSKSTSPKSKNHLYIERLIAETEFLENFRTVAEIRAKCEDLFQINLKSTSTSVTLKSLVEKKRLMRIKSSKRNNHYLYKTLS